MLYFLLSQGIDLQSVIHITTSDGKYTNDYVRYKTYAIGYHTVKLHSDHSDLCCCRNHGNSFLWHCHVALHPLQPFHSDTDYYAADNAYSGIYRRDMCLCISWLGIVQFPAPCGASTGGMEHCAVSYWPGLQYLPTCYFV